MGRLRQGLAASSDGFDNDIRVLHEHGNGCMLYRRGLHEAHGIHGFDDPFRECGRQSTERPVLFRLKGHVVVVDVFAREACGSRWSYKKFGELLHPGKGVGLHRHTLH